MKKKAELIYKKRALIDREYSPIRKEKGERALNQGFPTFFIIRTPLFR